MSTESTTDNRQVIAAYHQRTKHHLDQYAQGPETLDWEAQPDPFRRYQGTVQHRLPLTADTLTSRYVDLYTAQAIAPQPLNIDTLGALFELSLGLSAWKSFAGNTWPLRCNPSSGNLHPTEGYAVLPTLATLPAGVYHYVSHDHVLEQRGLFTESSQPILSSVLPENCFLVGFTSIPWREAWKYGERAFRYCQHDMGHALAALSYAAAALGWTARVLDNWADAEIILLLGTHRDADYPKKAEREFAEAIVCIDTTGQPQENGLEGHTFAALAEHIEWAGQANVLDRRHFYQWDIIDTALEATIKPTTEPLPTNLPTNLPAALPLNNDISAANLIRQRRSAQMFDWKTPLNQVDFFRLLDSSLSRNSIPWNIFPRQARIHLVIFVHRIIEIPPGLYLLIREPDSETALKTALNRPEFEWQRVAEAPSHMLLYRLVTANAQKAAMQLSCHQHIAAASNFSLGMLAEFDDALQAGAWHYKQLFWEAGMIGQVLYLEAEAVGVRGTGIGCYFDDAVHEMLGLEGTRYQSLYHFTVGTAQEDARLESYPPYAHLEPFHP